MLLNVITNFVCALGRKRAVLFLIAVLFPFNIASRLSPNPCTGCHNDGRYMHLHVHENPLFSPPASLIEGSKINITIIVQNLCDQDKNNVMFNVTTTLRSLNGNFRVDIPTRFINTLPVGVRELTWDVVAESPGIDILEFETIATNPHQQQTMVDTLVFAIEVISNSTMFYNLAFDVSDIDGFPVSEAKIRIGSVETFTDINGIATLSLPQNNYSYSVTKFGFETFNSSFTLESDFYVNVKLTQDLGEETGSDSLPFPFLGTLWFVVFLAVSLGFSGVGLGLLCMKGGNSTRSRFFIVSTAIISIILVIIITYALGFRVPSPLIKILGANHSLVHWIGWIGMSYLLGFMSLSVISKRKVRKFYPRSFRIHVIGNLLASVFATVHFMQQVTRPAGNYPDLGTGVAIYIIIMGLALSGYGTAFRFFRSEGKKARFLHTSFAVTLLVVMLIHIIHGISRPF